MAVYKNVAGQRLAVFAYDSTDGSPKTGDAANITAQISLDGGATAATNDPNPTELDATDAPGIYIFDLTQAETNADLIVVSPVSSTADVEIDPHIIYTTPGTNAGVLADTVRLNGSSTSAQNLERSASTIVIATASGVPTTTTMPASDLPGGLANDHYKDRTILWTSGALLKQGATITAYNGTTKVLTFTATTAAPTAGDTFVIV